MIDVIVEKTQDGKSVRITLTMGGNALPPSDLFVQLVGKEVERLINEKH